MDWERCFVENIFVEQLCRSIKREEVRPRAWADGREAGIGIGHWTNF
jgi:hypothetical protein